MTTAAQAFVTSPLPSDVRKPYAVDICESSVKAFQMATASIRQGYTIKESRYVDVYSTGVAAMTLVLGDATEAGYADAEEAKKIAILWEDAALQKQQEQEAKFQIEQRAAELEAKKTVLVEKHQRQIREFEKAAAAEIAALSK